jgi:ATP-dependent DNA helicase RecG
MGGEVLLTDELYKLVNDVIELRCERNNIELKKSLTAAPKHLYDTLSSFSNQVGGGIIIFGIDQENDYNICGVYDAQDLQVCVTEQSNQMQPIVRPLFTVAQIDGKTVVSAEIAECDISEKPCYYRGKGKANGSYIRVGDADLPMTDFEIYSYEAYRRKLEDELREVPEGIASRFDDSLVQLFLTKLRVEKPNFKNFSDSDALQMSGMIKNGKPTIAGLMLFGAFPQGVYPSLDITAVVVPGYGIGEVAENEARFVNNKRIDGTIPQMLESAMDFVNRVLKVSTVINENGKRADKIEFPKTAIREIILNAMIHRDYSINTERIPIRIMFFIDRLEVENPGGLYGRLTINELGKVGADTRNPYIASALEILVDTENRYSGIPTIRYEMEKAGLPPPVFDSTRGVFRVTLYNDFSKESENFASTDVNDNNKKILSFCIKPKSRYEISEHLNIISVPYVTKKFLTPLIEKGKLKMTIPEKPKSRYQKFYTAR